MDGDDTRAGSDGINVADGDLVRLAALHHLLGLMDADQAARIAAPDRYDAAMAAWPATSSDRRVMLEHADRFDASLTDPSAQRRRSSACPPDQRLVTGPLRRQLLHWLTQVSDWHLTDPQREALGDLPPDASMADAVHLLTGEGFELVFDDDLLPGLALAVMWHPDGLLAQVTSSHLRRAADETAGSPRFSGITVYYAAELLDLGLGLAGITGGSRTLVHDQHGHTHRLIGQLHYATSWTGSLRVALATLRAFGRLITPWPKPLVTSWLGGEPHPGVLGLVPGPHRGEPARTTWDQERYDRDSLLLMDVYAAASKGLLAGLPARVHQVLGPMWGGREQRAHVSG